MTKKNGIKADIYYFLLEWKDENLKLFQLIHPNKAMNDLSTQELIDLASALGYTDIV